MVVDGGRAGTVPMKHIALLTLVFQNSLLILVMHYSRTMPPVGGQRYFTSTAVFLNEVIKLAISLSMALYDIAKSPRTREPSTAAGIFSELARGVLTGDSWKLAIPAVLYTLQNSLQYVGISNLDAPTFQATYQIKILTTALFSVALLGRSLSARKWLSLLLLTAGVALVQIPTEKGYVKVLSIKDLKNGVAFHSPRSIWDLKALGNAAAGQLSKRSATYEGIEEDVGLANTEANATLGLLAVLVACVLSGLAGVYFEKILKDRRGEPQAVSIWVRNVQVSFYSLWPALFVGVIMKDGEHISKTGFFTGYNWVVWLAIFLQAVGGLVVALVINYSSTIAKNFATSMSILVSFLASVFFFDFHITRFYLVGTATVIGATYLYNSDSGTSRPPSINVINYEKSNEPAYFDIDAISAPIKSPSLRGEAISTSTPTTPTFERRPRGKSPARANVMGIDGACDTLARFIVTTMRFLSVHVIVPRQAVQPVKLSITTPTLFSSGRRMGEGFFGLVDELDALVRSDSSRTLDRQSGIQSQWHFPSHHGSQPQSRASRQGGPPRSHLSWQGGAPQGQFPWQGGPSSSSQPSIIQLRHFDLLGQPPRRNAWSNQPAQGHTQASAGHILPQQIADEDLASHLLPDLPSQRQLGINIRAQQAAAASPSASPSITTNSAPIVQGIQLIPTGVLPDRLRSIFPFPLFNAVQSKCFDSIYQSNDNFVLSSPTGSGKTAILELAVCRMIHGFAHGSYKIVYQAPTKSLCAERQRDWQAKFGPLDIACAELTGDTTHSHLQNVQHATIIITTPEKWDSITRKWKDHQKLMQMVKLFLIDEVHILKEDRGPTLEAVVSRMKSVGSDVRFVALSATVPNSDDIAIWLGKNPTDAHLPALRERFGEEFRPVRLQKHVCGYASSSNDFAFEQTLNSKLPEVITKWSQRKPIMVFCFTRKSCVETAKLLANWWATKSPNDRHWSAPLRQINVTDKELKYTISSAVAFHHAGLQPSDRLAVEKGYLDGAVNVICCTSTLAVGINLPCHFVIIKGTVTYQRNSAGCKEYSDLEVMQMLGRAGRPQFDSSAVAVIMTRAHSAKVYEMMIAGQEVLESCLHKHLIDHLNAEISLGTITNSSAAKKWLSGTFLYVRLKKNTSHYELDGKGLGENIDECIESICNNGIAKLEESNLIKLVPRLSCTEFGDAMARYYVQYDTMKMFMSLPPKARISEILSAIAQANEFRDIRWRNGEKQTYKELNQNDGIKFSIPIALNSPAHKVSLIIQSVLGGVDLPTDDAKQKIEYNGSKLMIFQHTQRLIRCIIDCQLCLDDAIASRNALMLARSFGAQVWDDSPLHMKQLETVGPVGVRKLSAAGIKSIDDIEAVDPHRLETALSRNPPYGSQLQKYASAFPKLRVSLHEMGKPIVQKDEVSLKIKAELGFLNEKVPEYFHKRPVYVCLLVERSDGTKVHFARISARRLDKGQDAPFTAQFTSFGQSLRAYVMCDEIAGTAKQAFLQPNIPSSMFPLNAIENTPNVSKRRRTAEQVATLDLTNEYELDEIKDSDLLAAAGDRHDDSNTYVDIDEIVIRPSKRQKTAAPPTSEQPAAKKLPNGKWACNHVCKDKTKCKHLCCREGLDKPPRPKKKNVAEAATPGAKETNTTTGKETRAILGLDKSPPATEQGDSQPKLKFAPRRNIRISSSPDLADFEEDIFDQVPMPTPLPRGNMEDDSDDPLGIADCLVPAPSMRAQRKLTGSWGSGTYSASGGNAGGLEPLVDSFGGEDTENAGSVKGSGIDVFREDTSVPDNTHELMDDEEAFPIIEEITPRAEVYQAGSANDEVSSSTVQEPTAHEGAYEPGPADDEEGLPSIQEPTSLEEVHQPGPANDEASSPTEEPALREAVPRPDLAHKSHPIPLADEPLSKEENLAAKPISCGTPNYLAQVKPTINEKHKQDKENTPPARDSMDEEDPLTKWFISEYGSESFEVT
ncbi:hypothetical protein K470DRAFT_266674 [Piedraia hortae CBS 480.64]|uniref:DNA 3'-5' helicase n=1 Tax=Piedraia hortae CBS 480.64 TaxID=1314780 RepID=A0A6A7BQY0_9PEZI|nr:hypothetical protein K470DRAFT_266674 [Piedraia hortae CBS 480.64]